jgi:hypothetical protein
MKRVILSGAAVFLMLAALAACGGKKSTTTTAVTVVLSPASASVTTGATQQFTATVGNTTNTAVTWTVNGISQGNSTVGFISSTGLYTAPNTVPTPASVTVAAKSEADTSVSGTATVTITAPATPSSPLTVSPQNVTLPAGGQQTFTATVSGNAIPVNWTLNCSSAAAGACGTITTAGVYTAPATPPPGGNVAVTATAKDNSVPAAGAVVTVQISNGTLNGQYAFHFSGQSASASYVAAGSITFDGAGNITGGIEDINNSGTASTVTITSGTYHIGTDGRGNASVVTSGGTVNWQFAVVNHNRIFVERFDAGVQSASGTMELQDTSQFTAAGFTGNYAFNLSGANSSSKPGSLAEAGALTSNGALLISSGVQDVNDGGSASTAAPVSGTYSTPSASFGNGTLTLNGTPFAYYIVDATHVKVVGKGAAAQLVGDLYKQPAGPFTNASIRNSFVFAFLGSSGGNPFGEGGVITLNGAGTVTGGTMDLNRNGNPQNGLAVSGTYNVADATTGRTTVTLSAGANNLIYVFYPQTNGALSVVEVDTSNVVAGRALQQVIGSFSAGSFQGDYAFNLSGTDFVVNPGEIDLVGHMAPNGGSAIAGSADISNNGVLKNSASLSGSYQVAVSGRGSPVTITTDSNLFTTGTFTIYIADNGDIFFLESDATRVLVGLAQRQF